MRANVIDVNSMTATIATAITITIEKNGFPPNTKLRVARDREWERMETDRKCARLWSFTYILCSMCNKTHGLSFILICFCHIWLHSVEKCCAGKYTKRFDILSSQEKKDFSFSFNHINFDAVCVCVWQFWAPHFCYDFTWTSAKWQRDNEKESENESHTYQRNRLLVFLHFYLMAGFIFFPNDKKTL